MATGEAGGIIRPVTPADHGAIWAILEPVLRAGETLAVGREDALALWLSPDRTVRVVEGDGALLGIFYVRANQPGGGNHVANAGYVTAGHATGRGVARRMCAASFDLARDLSFSAMQYNFVVSSNSRAVALWQAMGFAIVGRVPGAFVHPALGPVDTFVMHRYL
jgi:GNAT superfamily N-acetyltransferase